MTYLDKTCAQYDFFGDLKWEEQFKNPEFMFEILKNPINAIRPSKRPMKIIKTFVHHRPIQFGPSFQKSIKSK
jgi:hypothetical protein